MEIRKTLELIKTDKNATEKEKIRRLFVIRAIFISVMTITIVLMISYSITLGVSGVSAIDAYKAIINGFLPGTFDIESMTSRIIINLRAPRVVMGVLAGASLAIGGCITQAILKNSLATPYTLGVSSGAAFGAALAIILGISFTGGAILGIITNAFIFSLIPICIVLAASKFRVMTPMSMILCGVAISYIFGAVNMLLQYFADESALRSIVFWTVGDLTSVSLWNAMYLGPMMIFTFLFGMFIAKDINAMGMGDDTAKSLGVNVDRVRISGLVIACLLTATVICFTGAIGFICLLAPQISRMFVGEDFRYLLPSSALVGACLLTLADMGARTLMSPVLLPVGVLTALIGGPAFILLLFSRKRAMDSMKM